MRKMTEQESILSTTYHDRNLYGEESLIYPVFSRRLQGLSVGINTSPQRVCNFECVYCEVDFSQGARPIKFNVARADSELRTVLTDIQAGKFGSEPVIEKKYSNSN